MDKESFKVRLDRAKEGYYSGSSAKVDLPELGDDMYVFARAMSFNDYAKYVEMYDRLKDHFWPIIIASCKLEDGSYAFGESDIEFLESLGYDFRRRLYQRVIAVCGITSDDTLIAKANLIEVPYYDFLFTLIHGPYNGKTLAEVKELPISEIKEWQMRYDRCPWGPTVEHMRHYHLCCLQSSGKGKKDVFNLDKTHKILKNLRSDVLGLSMLDEMNSQEMAQKQQNFLLNIKAKYGKK